MFTVNDIIYDPKHEGVESIVGKKVFFGYRIKELLEEANSNSESYKGVLKEVTNKGFLIEGFSSEWEMIIPAPENKPRPFDSFEEFALAYDSVFDGFDSVGKCMFRGGFWLIDKNTNERLLVKGYTDDGIILEFDVLSWEYVLEHFLMPDKTPCGVKEE